MAQDVVLRLLAEQRDAIQGLKEVQAEVARTGQRVERTSQETATATGRMDKGFKSVLSSAKATGIGMVAAFGAAGALRAVKDMIGEASALEESINKVDVVFKSSGPEVQEWSQSTVESIGLARREALEYTGVLGNMLVPMGIAPEAASDMSRSLVELSADMASFNNANIEDTLLAIRSGLAGESEPLRRFGVFLDAARIKAEAMGARVEGTVGPLTAAEKAVAAYNVILADTADAQGDFARTSDGLANQQRILGAEWKEAQAAIGTLLIPAMQGLVGVTRDVIAAVSLAVDGLREIGRVVGQVEAAIDGVFRGVAEGLEDLGVEGATKWYDGFVRESKRALLSPPWELPEVYLSWIRGSEENGERIAVAQWEAFARATRDAQAQIQREHQVVLDAYGARWQAAGALHGTTYASNFVAGFDEIQAAAIAMSNRLRDIINNDLANARAAFDSATFVGGPADFSQGAVTGTELRGTVHPIGTGNQAGATSSRSIIGTPGVGTHAQSDWQSRNAVDIKGNPGSPVLAVEGGTIVKTGGVDGVVRVGGKIIFGRSVTIAGHSGTQHFYTHLADLQVSGGTVRTGQVIGFIANGEAVGNVSHVHYAVDRGSPQSWVSGGTVHGGLGKIPDAAGQEPEISVPASSSSSGASSGASSTSASETRTPPKPPTIVGRRGAPGNRGREFSRRRSEFATVGRLFERAADEGILGEALANRTEKAIKTIRFILKDGIITEDEARTMDKLLGNVGDNLRDRLNEYKQVIRDRLDDALDTWRKTVEENRKSVENALSSVASGGLNAFDEQTSQVLEANRERLDQLTASERALEQLRARRRADEGGRNISGGHDELTLALASGDPQRIRDAQRALDDAWLDEHERSLEQKADQERAALEASVSADEARLRDERDLARENLRVLLEGLETEFREGELSAKNAQERLLGLLELYGVDYENVGTRLGSAFRFAFERELGDLETSVTGLQDVVTGKPTKATVGRPGRQSFRWFNEIWTKGERSEFAKLLRDRSNRSYKDWADQFPELAAVFAARGGIVTRPVIAGEAGPEGIVPLTDPRALAMIGGAIGQHMPGGPMVVINATVLGTTSSEVEQALGRVVDQALRRRISYTRG